MSEVIEGPQETHEEWAARVIRERMSCNRAQAIIAMREAGILPDVEQYMSDPLTPQVAKDAWANSPKFLRLSPLVVSVADALELTESQLDELFKSAMQVEA